MMARKQRMNCTGWNRSRIAVVDRVCEVPGRVWKRLCTMVWLVVTPFAMTGCYDRQELEQQAFVSVLGVDKAPDGLIDCTFRIALPVNPTGGGGGNRPSRWLARSLSPFVRTVLTRRWCWRPDRLNGTSRFRI
ncbi:hypothetical protein [Alicyclobacillus fastidiosus]|uniref:hypothetical protein n=1 Tax=Alicyclobacillus fastidiosus TaxID=392011 RepID=UPI0023EA0D08|nr:hypothetical protein [Alicyclobacillus fastidiosus]GMA61853.1 hypothetical protein GCM10025859_22930 [Alicyclobacillus fastidiosus]